jgi:hypothetical protein
LLKLRFPLDGTSIKNEWSISPIGFGGVNAGTARKEHQFALYEQISINLI